MPNAKCKRQVPNANAKTKVTKATATVRVQTPPCMYGLASMPFTTKQRELCPVLVVPVVAIAIAISLTIACCDSFYPPPVEVLRRRLETDNCFFENVGHTTRHRVGALASGLDLSVLVRREFSIQASLRVSQEDHQPIVCWMSEWFSQLATAALLLRTASDCCVAKTLPCFFLLAVSALCFGFVCFVFSFFASVGLLPFLRCFGVKFPRKSWSILLKSTLLSAFFLSHCPVALHRGARRDPPSIIFQ